MTEANRYERTPKYDLGDPGPDSFTAHMQALKHEYTAWRVEKAEKKRQIPDIIAIHDEFESLIHRHLLKKGNHLGNFEYKKSKH